jgi:putative FmdB family regulatory protein
VLLSKIAHKGAGMPVYEFYCEQCNTIFNFYSRSVNTSKQPVCPRCKEVKLRRFLSSFSVLRQGPEGDSAGSTSFDEKRMEDAMGMLAKEAENIDEDDPKQAAHVMRKLSEISGLNLGRGMKEAIERMEAGEDPEKIEEEMGDILEEEPFTFPEKRSPRSTPKTPLRDETLYDL